MEILAYILPLVNDDWRLSVLKRTVDVYRDIGSFEERCTTLQLYKEEIERTFGKNAGETATRVWKALIVYEAFCRCVDDLLHAELLPLSYDKLKQDPNAPEVQPLLWWTDLIVNGRSRKKILARSMKAYLTELSKHFSKDSTPDLFTLLHQSRNRDLLSLILMSPIVLQYSIEIKKEVAVTPADIVVALLRIGKKEKRPYFVAHVRDVAERIIELWKEIGLKQANISSDELYKKDAFVIALATVVMSRCDVHISTWEKPELRLPPRMLGFDSVYVEEGFVQALQRAWGW